MELSIGQAGKKNLQGSRLQRILETPKNVSRYLVTTRATGIGCMNKVHRNFPMVGNRKGKGHIGSQEFIREYLRDILQTQEQRLLNVRIARMCSDPREF